MKFIMFLLTTIKSMLIKRKQKPVLNEFSNFLLKLDDLQFFVEPPVDPPTDPVDPPVEPPTKIEFSPEQQAEIDRIFGVRLGKAQSKWEKDYQVKLDAAKTEAEKLAKMNADQKAEYESQKREDELVKRESEITRRELRATALETLAEKGLPKTLADILVFTDAEATNSSLEAVEKAFREAVEAGVNDRLRSAPPGGGGSRGEGQKNPWKKGPDFNLTEQGKILKENPDLAKQLIAAAK